MKKVLVLLMTVFAAAACKGGRQMPGSTGYKTLTVTTSDLQLYSSYSASIRGKQDVDVYPQISGKLTDVKVKEGANVKKGELLFIIDQAPYKAALAKAKANVESAKASLATSQMTYNSKKELYKEKVVSDFDLQSAKNSLLTQQASLTQAKAELLNAQTNLSYTEIKSPANGVAGMVSMRIGALVSSVMTSPLISISDNSSMQVYFSMAEKDYLSYTKGKTQKVSIAEMFPSVRLVTADGSEYSEDGKIDAVSGIVDASTGSISLRATFPNGNRTLLSGSNGTVRLPYNKKDCIVIPQEATYEIQDKIFVYRVINGKTSATAINVFSVNNGRDYVVESGLKKGDVIIASGAGLLRDGIVVADISSNASGRSDKKR